MENQNSQNLLSEVQINSVITLYSNGKFNEAINRIKELNETYPNVPLLFNILGACYKAIGNLEGAKQMFETATKIKPNYAEAYFNLLRHLLLNNKEGVIENQKKDNQW